MRRVNRRPEKLTPRISIVIPARNEARNLEVILPELPPVHQVILVDGHSVDDTIATAQRVMPDIEVIHQTRTGKGNALACGFAAVTGDIVVMFDADGSADPAEIPRFVAALVGGADVAKGSRFAPGGGSEDITHFRRLGNYGLNVLTNVLLGTKYTDLCYGYNAFWAHALPHLELPATTLPRRGDGTMHWGDGFEIETVLNCRFAAVGMR
ncbi:MAG: glycosyltransferase family 2 protein, partial [Glaciihabitans sp.]